MTVDERIGMTQAEVKEWFARERAIAPTLPTPACPSWCERGANHPWDEVNELRRHHSLTAGVGRNFVEIWTSTEVADPKFDPAIFINIDHECDAAEARELAAALLRLADILEGKI